MIINIFLDWQSKKCEDIDGFFEKEEKTNGFF